MQFLSRLLRAGSGGPQSTGLTLLLGVARGRCFVVASSCDVHTHTPAKASSTNFLLYPFVLHISSTDCLGHWHGYAYHSPSCLKMLQT